MKKYNLNNIPINIQKNLLYIMLKIRHFEEKIKELYPTQEIKTPVHLYIGQEAIAAAVCQSLNRDDYIFSNHRGHGHYIAKGADIRYLMAELYGKVSGCSKGKGGSMHLVAPECGILGTSAIVGGGIAIAVGTALASKANKEARVSVAFFGDGAVEEGIFHESLNFASLRKLPCVFVCENNFYATNSHISARQYPYNIAKRAEGYNMPGIQVDGNDVLNIYKLAKQAIKRARNDQGPTLIECLTYRWCGHVGSELDYEIGCRPKGELQEWIDKCPIKRYTQHLIDNSIINESEFHSIINDVNNEIENALEFAHGSLSPDRDDLFKDVYYEKA